MYTILVNDDNTLLVTKKERIMQRSKLVDTLCFLSSEKYNDVNLSECTVLMEYLMPVSRRYRSEILELSEDRYEGYLKYTLPFNTKLTAEAGAVEVQLSFIRTDLDDNGVGVQQVRKTSTTSINIVPIAAWSDIIPDCALSALDQRIIKMDAQIKAITASGELFNSDKADNIRYNEETNEIQLMSNNEPIGDKVALKCPPDIDGDPVVDFSVIEDTGGDDDKEDSTDVVEF